MHTHMHIHALFVHTYASRPIAFVRYIHGVSLATSGRSVAGQGRPSPPTILSQTYIYYETSVYIVTTWKRARAHVLKPAHAENYDSDALASSSRVYLARNRPAHMAFRKRKKKKRARSANLRSTRAPSEVLNGPLLLYRVL